MRFNKKLLAGLVALAAGSSSAQAVTVMAEDGWTLGVSGLINQFAVFTDDSNRKDNGAQSNDMSEIRDGLLPAFINFDAKAPTINGLDIAAHISISPSTNTKSQSASTLEQREVYFTVDGSFGQVLAGKALGLYGSHAILNEQTIYGVGWGVGGNTYTTLGGIGMGYDYADWRSQFRWTSPDMNGFKLALAVVDGEGPAVSLPTGLTGPLTIVSGHTDGEDLRYEYDLTYAGSFAGGKFKTWFSGAFQDHDELKSADRAKPEDARYWAVGGTLSVNNFEFMAVYSDAEDSVLAASGLNAYDLDTDGNGEWSQYVVQGGYRFGSTLVSANYSELETDSARARPNGKKYDEAERITVGVYHDVNANLKLVAEYTEVEHDDKDRLDQDIFAIGGFVFF